MNRILILFAHPVFEKSRIHGRLLAHAAGVKGVTIHDLYEWYPDMDIDVKREQQLLMEHDIIIWQHPFYWYSAPAILKQWIDLVLEYNWAYGPQGTNLSGKKIFNALSCGGSKEVYSRDGRNRYSIQQFLAPFEQTARLCRMEYLPPFVIHGTHRLQATDIELYAVQYLQLLIALVNDRISEQEHGTVTYLNELCPVPQPLAS